MWSHYVITKTWSYYVIHQYVVLLHELQTARRPRNKPDTITFVHMRFLFETIRNHTDCATSKNQGPAARGGGGGGNEGGQAGETYLLSGRSFLFFPDKKHLIPFSFSFFFGPERR